MGTLMGEEHWGGGVTEGLAELPMPPTTGVTAG